MALNTDMMRDKPVREKKTNRQLSASQENLPQKLAYALNELREQKDLVKLLEADLEDKQDEVDNLDKMLLQAGKLSGLGEMLTMVVHELNQPLTTILGYIQILASEAETGSTQLSDLKKIEKQLHRMTGMVNNVRTFGRKDQSQLQTINIHYPLQDALFLLDHQLKSSEIQLTKTLADNLPEISGDKNQLQQVFINILSNARDALEKSADKRIHIITKEQEDCIIIEIKNSGPPIPEALKQQIFEAFYTSKGPGKGTGLGLAITQRIISEHQGRVQVCSEPGFGCVFKIVLKAA